MPLVVVNFELKILVMLQIAVSFIYNIDDHD